MEFEVLTMLPGIALAALVAACGAGFRVLSGRLDRLEDKVDRLEAKMDNLIMALARSGVLVDPHMAGLGSTPPTTDSPHAARSPPPEPSGPEAAPA